MAQLVTPRGKNVLLNPFLASSNNIVWTSTSARSSGARMSRTVVALGRGNRFRKRSLPGNYAHLKYWWTLSRISGTPEEAGAINHMLGTAISPAISKHIYPGASTPPRHFKFKVRRVEMRSTVHRLLGHTVDT